jgi:acyl-coenzyme A synthetase/AMP-(fatty) acid ligase
LKGLRRSLPPYALPEVIDIVAGLPRTPTGKVDRKQLAAEIMEGSGTHD